MHGLAAPGKRRTDLARLQKGAQLVASFCLDLVVLKNVEVIRIVAGPRRQLDLRDRLQAIPVETGQRPPALDGRVVGREAEIENRGLQVVQTRVEPPAHDLAVGAAAMIVKLEDAFVDVLAVGYNRPAIAQTPQRLGGKEADGAGHAESSRGASLKSRAQRLGRILDDDQTMAIRDDFERLHVRRAPVQLRRQDRAGARRHGMLDGFWVYQMIVTAFDRHRSRAREMNRSGRRHHGVRTENHFIARSDACGAQSE